MAASLELVVFDFDGTLADTREAVAVVVNAALHDHGLPRVAPRFIHHQMGLPLETLFRKTLPPHERERVDLPSLVRWYREHFDTLGAPRVAPYAGVERVLDEVAGRGLRAAIATSRERSSLDPLLDRFGLADRFEVIATCDRVRVGKPDPEMLHLVLGEAGVDAGAAWMVGDTRYDVEMARSAGVFSVGVGEGCHDAEALRAAGADRVLDRLSELVDLLGTP